MLWSGLSQVTHKAIFVFHTKTTHARQLPTPTLPAHILSSSACSPPLSLSHSFQTCCGFLDYIFGHINSWCPAPQLLFALTQIATNC
ncbi:unnamed protein product [Hymenolepis diminuta]|uniref:Uncharacterized protein n=1 Tax=Hymenolepis diminuta TaxID=6216 RepID=A0A564ZCE2_HYMDI|nr:unnamed protein product [Hymenolepis diminuta]